jgi:hypothetical protein
MSQSNYADVFQYSLSRGYIDCAKTLLPHIESLSNISICSLIDRMMTIMDAASRRKRIMSGKIVADNAATRSLDNILSNYLNVFMFLDEIGYTFESGDDIISLFAISNGEYEIYGKNECYLKIIRCVINMCTADAKSEFFTDECINSGYIAGIRLLDELNLFEIYDFDGDCSIQKDFVTMLEIFQKNQMLNDNNVTKIFSHLFDKQWNVSIHDIEKMLGDFSVFVKKYDYCVTIDNQTFGKILKTFEYPEQIIKLALELSHKINIDMQVKIHSESMYGILTSYGINAILYDKTNDDNDSE